MTDMTARDYAKLGFDEFLESSDKEFPFSFDDVWNFMEREKADKAWQVYIDEFHKEVDESESCLGHNMLNAVMPVEHKFTEKQYIREFRAPAEHVIVSKIHNTNHPIFLLEGDVTIVEKGVTKRVKAPYYSITEVGTKRIVYVHEDCFFVTVHPADSTTVSDVENEILADSWGDVKLDPKCSNEVKNLLNEVRNTK